MKVFIAKIDYFDPDSYGYWQRHMEVETQKVVVRTLKMSLTNWVMME